MSRYCRLAEIFLLTSLTLALQACGGGGGGGSGNLATTSADRSVLSDALVLASGNITLNIKVIDGPLQNALVCLDKNRNDECDADEVQARTNGQGIAVLDVPPQQQGQFPVVAVVGTDAVDLDTGAVPVPFKLSAPADQPALVSPLTHLVQKSIALHGHSSSVAASQVKKAAGLAISAFADYTLSPADPASTYAAAVARMLVIGAQKQRQIVQSSVGQIAADGVSITSLDLDRAIQTKLADLLPQWVAAVSDSSITNAATQASRESLLQTKAADLVNSAGLNNTSVARAVAIDRLALANSGGSPTATFQLVNLFYLDPNNISFKTMSSSSAQNTPDANNNIKYVVRNTLISSGAEGQWGHGTSSARNSDLHWNGVAWVHCAPNFENQSSVRDADGNTTYNYCDNLEIGTTHRTAPDLTGHYMTDILDAIKAEGYAKFSITNAQQVFGTTTFPKGSLAYFHYDMAQSLAISYYPGSDITPGSSNVLVQYPADVAAGGDSRTSQGNHPCNSPAANGSGINSTTFELLIPVMKGTPCVFNQTTLNNNGNTFKSLVPNEWWGNSTVDLGKIGTAAVNSGIATDYYTTNTKFKVAFKGQSPNSTAYYACKESFATGNVRNCVEIGTGTYVITTRADARTMEFTNLPAAMAELSFERVLVERNGLIYLGYKDKPLEVRTTRLNTIAASALLYQLGLQPVNPSLPIELTAGSYRGTWDLQLDGPTSNQVLRLFIPASVTPAGCSQVGATSFSCDLSISQPSDGTFTLRVLEYQFNGKLEFLSGQGSGTYQTPTGSGTWIAKRL